MPYKEVFNKYTDKIKNAYGYYCSIGWLPRLAYLYAVSDVFVTLSKELEEVTETLSDELGINLFD